MNVLVMRMPVPKRWNQDFTERRLMKVRAQRRHEFRTFLLGNGINLSEVQLDATMPHVFAAIVRADNLILKYQQGEYISEKPSDSSPKVDLSMLAIDSDGVKEGLKKYSTLGLFDAMASERGYAASSIKRHRPIIESVAAVHFDIRSVTPDWCVTWKDGLIKRGLNPTTVQAAYMSALRNLCNFAIANRRLTENPMDGIFIKVPKKKRNRTQVGYTEAEARVALAATLTEPPAHLAPDQVRARRWLPWLCCYLGARVGEITQLRRQDLVLEDTVWTVRISPDAGTTKSGQARRVPLHPHLIAQGVVEMITALPDGRIFCDAEGKRSPATVADDHARWVRSVGLTDPDLQPAHGWRHRFKTVARRVKMDSAVRDYIQGHVPHNEAENYGNQEAPILLDWISILKWIEVDGDESLTKRIPVDLTGPTLVWSH
jgi:integrase